MLNHSTQLSLFRLKTKEFKDTKSSRATYKLNDFIRNHNLKKNKAHKIEPVDIKFYVSNKIAYILLAYVPVK